MKKKRNAYMVLVEKPEGKRSLRSRRHGWVVGWTILKWILER
jgi:hypothetical protein